MACGQPWSTMVKHGQPLSTTATTMTFLTLLTKGELMKSFEVQKLMDLIASLAAASRSSLACLHQAPQQDVQVRPMSRNRRSDSARLF